MNKTEAEGSKPSALATGSTADGAVEAVLGDEEVDELTRAEVTYSLCCGIHGALVRAAAIELRARRAGAKRPERCPTCGNTWDDCGRRGPPCVTTP